MDIFHWISTIRWVFQVHILGCHFKIFPILYKYHFSIEIISILCYATMVKVTSIRWKWYNNAHVMCQIIWSSVGWSGRWLSTFTVFFCYQVGAPRLKNECGFRGVKFHNSFCRFHFDNKLLKSIHSRRIIVYLGAFLFSLKQLTAKISIDVQATLIYTICY